MVRGTVTERDRQFMRLAFEQMREGYHAGGVPVGSVITEGDALLAAGHNKRVQNGDPIAHGEMDCLRSLGRRKHYRTLTLYTTLSPCFMCSGAVLQFEIPRVVVGDIENFKGAAHLLVEHGVDVVLMHDPECMALMAQFIRERPDLWHEDIAENSAQVSVRSD